MKGGSNVGRGDLEEEAERWRKRRRERRYTRVDSFPLVMKLSPRDTISLLDFDDHRSPWTSV